MQRKKNRPNGDDAEEHKLGPCCVCETLIGVRNILMLGQKSPTPGHGWGCVQCGLPADGASAVVCDMCLEKPLKFACSGYPGIDGRIPIEELSGEMEHDYPKHPEAWWFEDSPDAGHPDCICSVCRKQINDDDNPLRIYEDKFEARFHNDCFKRVQQAQGFFNDPNHPLSF